jgi:hypothetical protein
MRFPTVVLILLSVGVGVSLFLVKHRVQGLDEALQNINKGIVDDRETIHVLRAEWSYLNEPGRLKALAEHYLNMVPIGPEQVTTPLGLDERLAKKATPDFMHPVWMQETRP